MQKETLFSVSYLCALAANFLLFFGFYLLLPILPFYLEEAFHTPKSAIGLILASYTIAALCIRPFSGYLVDTLARRPLYLIAFFLFAAVFAGYMMAATITFFTILRVIHGVAFGTVTVAGSTLVIDIMPASRRGEGLGYYGLMNNSAMAIGPMTGLFLHDHHSFEIIFITALSTCSLGFLVALFIKSPTKIPVESRPLSLDRFILLRGMRAGFSLLLLSIPYAITTTYIAIYAKQIGVTTSAGLFFSLMAAGMAISRLISGKQVDKGFITKVIKQGMILVGFSYLVIGLTPQVMLLNHATGEALFFAAAFFLGYGFGTMFPAFNTLFVNLASNNQRGTANSTYLTSWDVGIGIGLVLGGYIGQISTFNYAYLLGGLLSFVGVYYFQTIVSGHFEKTRLR